MGNQEENCDKKSGKNNFMKFLETRLAECQNENKLYYAKYIDIREFAYKSVEALMRQLNAKKRNVIQNSNMNVYKQLFEKERKHLHEAKTNTDLAMSNL